MTNLTTQTMKLFTTLAEDAANWSGEPLLDITKAQRGNLTDLKINGLIETFKSDGCDWVSFTDLGRDLATTIGFEIEE